MVTSPALLTEKRANQGLSWHDIREQPLQAYAKRLVVESPQ